MKGVVVTLDFFAVNNNGEKVKKFFVSTVKKRYDENDIAKGYPN